MCTFVWTVIVFNWVYYTKMLQYKLWNLGFYETKRCCKHFMGDCYIARTQALVGHVWLNSKQF